MCVFKYVLKDVYHKVCTILCVSYGAYLKVYVLKRVLMGMFKSGRLKKVSDFNWEYLSCLSQSARLIDSLTNHTCKSSK